MKNILRLITCIIDRKQKTSLMFEAEVVLEKWQTIFYMYYIIISHVPVCSV